MCVRSESHLDHRQAEERERERERERDESMLTDRLAKALYCADVDKKHELKCYPSVLVSHISLMHCSVSEVLLTTANPT